MGHTHEDIDGIWEVIRKINAKGYISLSKMMDSYRTCEYHNSYVSYLID